MKKPRAHPRRSCRRRVITSGWNPDPTLTSDTIVCIVVAPTVSPFHRHCDRVTSPTPHPTPPHPTAPYPATNKNTTWIRLGAVAQRSAANLSWILSACSGHNPRPADNTKMRLLLVIRSIRDRYIINNNWIYYNDERLYIYYIIRISHAFIVLHLLYSPHAVTQESTLKFRRIWLIITTRPTSSSNFVQFQLANFTHRSACI